MRKIWPLLGLILLSSCQVPAPTYTPPPAPTPTSKPVLVSAHRGGGGLAPENTLASFRNGLTFHPDFLETDVHLSKDGSVVVIHDTTIDRTTNGHGQVSDFTLAELQSFNAAANYPGATSQEPVPAFGQVLDLAKPTQTGLEVEIKVASDGKPYPGIVQKVWNEINARGMLDRVRIMAFEYDTLKEMHALDPHVKTVALMSTSFFRGKDIDQTAPIVDAVAPFSSGIGVDKTLLTPKLVAEAHKRGLSVGVWTPDTEEEMTRFIKMGVDSITTNRPDLLNKVLGK